MTTLAWLLLAAQAAQNPSPMVEHARSHQRVEQVEIAGERRNLSLGRLLAGRAGGPLLIHFHGAAWLAEVSARKWRKDASVLAVEIGVGSGVYSRAFSDPARFGQLLDEAGGRFSPVVVSGFSAGYGAVREILRNRENWRGSTQWCSPTPCTPATIRKASPARSIRKASRRLWNSPGRWWPGASVS